MPNILCIETATQVCSVAIGNRISCVNNQTIVESNRHSVALTGLIKTCLDQARVQFSDLSAVAISNGPGSYTGLRVGASTAKAICYALSIPLISISSLDTLIHSIPSGNTNRVIMPTIDARRMEVYTAFYSAKKKLLKEPYSLVISTESLKSIVNTYGDVIICGNGADKCTELASAFGEVSIIPTACNASLLCAPAYDKFQQNRFANLAYHKPFYYKSPNITESKSQL